MRGRQSSRHQAGKDSGTLEQGNGAGAHWELGVKVVIGPGSEVSWR